MKWPLLQLIHSHRWLLSSTWLIMCLVLLDVGNNCCDNSFVSFNRASSSNTLGEVKFYISYKSNIVGMCDYNKKHGTSHSLLVHFIKLIGIELLLARHELDEFIASDQILDLEVMLLNMDDLACGHVVEVLESVNHFVNKFTIPFCEHGILFVMKCWFFFALCQSSLFRF